MPKLAHISTCSRMSVDTGELPIRVARIVNIDKNADPLDSQCPFAGHNHALNVSLSIHDMKLEVIQFGIFEDIHIYVIQCPDCHRIFGLRQLIGEVE